MPSVSSQLPDEIIKEILTPALHVPDASFASSAWVSPFAEYQLTSSTVLAVCKSWLRVATPLLYETVILRSKAQAQALAATLKKNPQLGLFVKKIRLEGGYGNSVYDILKRCSDVVDLWITTSLHATESVGGYARGFQLINPRRLILKDVSYPRLAIIRQLHGILLDVMRTKWKKLDIFHWSGGHGFEDSFLKAVASSKVPTVCFEEDILRYSASILPQLSKIPTLESITIHTKREKPEFDSPPPVDDFPFYFFDEHRELNSVLKSDRDLYNKVTFVDPDPTPRLSASQGVRTSAKKDVAFSAPLNPDFRPLSRASDADRKRIWTEIIRHAVDMAETSGITGWTLGIKRQYAKLEELHGLQKLRARMTLVSKGILRETGAVLQDLAMETHHFFSRR
ncbi:hypothetical protein CC2G_007019 [Coprinopsis cinerea AmutBmut pab1-1]|nr:hypothetical protein CC2G_007019 [Coprinopsis cinerea AmutBmut pab1-1]